jgi:hypothetical protein
MVERTSTGEARWTLVEANDKNYARVKILRILCERLEAALQDQPKAERETAGKSDKAKAKKAKKQSESHKPKAASAKIQV